MKQYLAAVATGLVLMAPPAQADVTFEFLFEGGYPLSVSNDGTIVAGNLANGSFGSFRWTTVDGVTALGRNTHGGGGGKTRMSADGTRISATISTAADSLLRGQGLWTLGSGWQDLAPLPPDAAFQDGGIGSAWAISGDGTAVVGLYTRTGPGARAHASKWTAGTGMFDIGQTNHSQASRANGVNFDGSVVVGWVEHWQGPWRPAAWINNAPATLLSDADTTGATLYGMGQALNVSQNGDYVVGYMTTLPTKQRAATMWKRVGGVFGPPQVLGWVDGTTPEYGINQGEAVSEDGDIVVGYCTYDGDPFATTGFVWTEETGVIDVNQYLVENGVLIDPNFVIQSMSAMTPDGLQLFGFGKMLTPPYATRGFKITRSGLVGVPGMPTAARLELSAPRPNPSAATSRLEFTLPVAGMAELSIYDTAGRRIATLLREDLGVGPHSATWDGRDAAGHPVPAGVYFARLVTGQDSSSRRIVRVN